MKITRRILQEIIKEEVQNVLLTEGKIDLPGGKFTGLSGYKFHTDPDTWDIDYGQRLEDLEQEVRLFDWMPAGYNNKKIKNRSRGNLFDREILAADKRNFLDKMKDNKLARKFTQEEREKDPEDHTNTSMRALYRNFRTSESDIAEHYGKLWTELVMRHAFKNTAFFDGALKQVVTFDEMVEYLEDSLSDAQATNTNRFEGISIKIPYVNWGEIAKGLEYDTEVRKIFDKEIAQRKERLEQQKKTQEKDEEEEQLSEVKQIISEEVIAVYSEQFAKEIKMLQEGRITEEKFLSYLKRKAVPYATAIAIAASALSPAAAAAKVPDIHQDVATQTQKKEDAKMQVNEYASEHTQIDFEREDGTSISIVVFMSRGDMKAAEKSVKTDSDLDRKTVQTKEGTQEIIISTSKHATPGAEKLKGTPYKGGYTIIKMKDGKILSEKGGEFQSIGGEMPAQLKNLVNQAMQGKIGDLGGL